MGDGHGAGCSEPQAPEEGPPSGQSQEPAEGSARPQHLGLVPGWSQEEGGRLGEQGGRVPATHCSQPTADSSSLQDAEGGCLGQRPGGILQGQDRLEDDVQH